MKDDQGLDSRFVLFIHFLGASDAAKDWPAERVQEFVNLLTWLAHCPGSEALRDISSEDGGYTISVVPEVTIFSDCVVVSYDECGDGHRQFWTEAVCKDAVKIISIAADAALSLGLLVRGGMAFGQCHHDLGVVFGAAMAEAHGLEARQAKVPIVLLDDYIVKMLGPEPQKFGHIIQQDTDQRWFLNYYDHMIRHGVSSDPDAGESADVWKKAHLETIDREIAGLREEHDDEARERAAKWEWFRAKFQSVTLQSLDSTDKWKGLSRPGRQRL